MHIHELSRASRESWLNTQLRDLSVGFAAKKKTKGGELGEWKRWRALKKKSKLRSREKGADFELCSALPAAWQDRGARPTLPGHLPGRAERPGAGTPGHGCAPQPHTRSRSAALTSARPGGSSRELAAMPGQSRVPRFCYSPCSAAFPRPAPAGPPPRSPVPARRAAASAF